MSNYVSIPDEVITSKIYLIRDQKVMLDRDLAELYEVETRVLKQSVRRNIKRFPSDFMFEMSKPEFDDWRSQNVTSNADKKGLRYAPFCFTEQGVTMLSCILNSDKSIEVNIKIIRVFTKMREIILTSKDVLLEMETIKKRITGQDERIDMVFDYLTKFITQEEEPIRKVGFKRNKGN